MKAGAMTAANETFQNMAVRLGRGADPVNVSAERSDNGPRVSGGLVRLLLTFTLVLAAFTGLVFLAVWLIGQELAQAGHSADETPRQIVVGNDVLNIPANMIRFRSQRNAAQAQRIDLYALWPSLEGYSEANATAFTGTAINESLIFVTIEPRSMTQDMSGRMTPIYEKFFTGPPSEAGHGLLKRPLSTAGGFAAEELWYEAASPYPYAARCIRAEAGGATPYCLRDLHMGRDITVTYRFHSALIGEWMAIERAVRNRVNRMLYR